MKVIVCGGRDFENEARIYDVLDKLHEKHRFELVGAACQAKIAATTKA